VNRIIWFLFLNRKDRKNSKIRDH